MMKLPSLRSLTSPYTLDRPYARIANVSGVVLVASVTVGWESHQMKAFVTDDSAGIDTQALQWAAVTDLALVGLGRALLLRRYRCILRVVTHGTAIQGIVQKIAVSTTRLPAEKHLGIESSFGELKAKMMAQRRRKTKVGKFIMTINKLTAIISHKREKTAKKDYLVRRGVYESGSLLCLSLAHLKESAMGTMLHLS